MRGGRRYLRLAPEARLLEVEVPLDAAHHLRKPCHGRRYTYLLPTREKTSSDPHRSSLGRANLDVREPAEPWHAACIFIRLCNSGPKRAAVLTPMAL